MSSTATGGGFAALMRKVYGPAVTLLPKDGSIAAAMKFVPMEQRDGQSYNFPIKVSHEHGVTFNIDYSAYTLNASVDSAWVEATLAGAEMTLTGDLPLATVMRMLNSKGADGDGVRRKVDGMLESLDFYREIFTMYGGGSGATLLANIGVLNAKISGTNLGSGEVVSITKATWSAGIWNNMIGAHVDVYQADGATLVESDCVVSAPSLSNNRITLTKAGSSAVCATGYLLIPRLSKAKMCVGVQGIAENTGTFAGISVASYPQWGFLSQSAGSTTLSKDVIKRLAARLKQNGASGGADLYLNANAFADLDIEISDNERYNEPQGDKTTGVDSFTIRSAIGPIRVIDYTYMKQGIGLLLTKNNGRRIGACDITTGNVGKSGDWFYQDLESSNGGRLRAYSNQAPIFERPYHCAIINNIVSSGDTAP
jgi:hypothetical protein